MLDTTLDVRGKNTKTVKKTKVIKKCSSHQFARDFVVETNRWTHHDNTIYHLFCGKLKYSGNLETHHLWPKEGFPRRFKLCGVTQI